MYHCTCLRPLLIGQVASRFAEEACGEGLLLLKQQKQILDKQVAESVEDLGESTSPVGEPIELASETSDTKTCVDFGPDSIAVSKDASVSNECAGPGDKGSSINWDISGGNGRSSSSLGCRLDSRLSVKSETVRD
jgi:hypothetical protein